MAYEAILARDYPVILTVNFVSAVLVLIGTLVSDILYLVVDPRIRL
jgi:peptide/nickel transport system permease protein